MPIQTYGADDGTNGITTRMQTVLGRANFKVMMPDTIWICAGPTVYQQPFNGTGPNEVEGGIINGMVAHSRTRCLPDKKRPEYPNRMYAHCRFTINAEVIHGAVTRRFHLINKVENFDIPLDSESDEVRITYTLEYDTNDKTRNGYVGFNYKDPVFEITDLDRMIDWKQGAQQMKVVDISADATRLKLRTLTGEGEVAKLMDDIALEIPVSQFVAQMTDRCSSITTGKELRKRCEHVQKYSYSPWKCRIRSVFCDGWRNDCANYKPLKGCEMYIAMQKFTRNESIIEMDDDQVKYLFDQKEGLGLIPWSEWRGSWLDWMAHLCSKLSALRSGVFYYCHKFDTAPYENNCLSCAASYNWMFSQLLLGDKAFWRYVLPSQSLDLTYHSKLQTEIVLKSEDVCVTNANDRGEAMGEPDNWAVHGRFVDPQAPKLTPVTYLPEALPEGLYEVWLYCKNSLKYPFALIFENDNNFTQVDKISAGYSDRVALEIPQAASYQWVQLQQRRPDRYGVWLAPFQRLTFGLAPLEFSKTITADQFAVGDEFAFKAVHIERVK